MGIAGDDELEQTDNRPREEDGEQESIDQLPVAPPGSPG